MLKKLLNFLIILTIAMTLIGCPSGAKYPLGELGTVPIDRNLLGIWETGDDYDVQKVEFIENDPYSYFIKILTYNEDYFGDTYYIGYITNIGANKYLYARPLGSGGDEVNYYCFNINLTNNTMTSPEVNVTDTTISSTEELRKYCATHYYTDDYFLSPITLWIKDAKIFFVNLYDEPFDVRLGETSRPVFTMTNLPSHETSHLLNTTDLEDNFLYYKPSSETEWIRWKNEENIPYHCSVEGGKIHAIIAQQNGEISYYILDDDVGFNPKITLLNGTEKKLKVMKIGESWEFNSVAFIDDFGPHEMTNFKAIPTGNYGLFWLLQDARQSGYYFLTREGTGNVKQVPFEAGRYYIYFIFSENNIFHAGLYDITSPW